MFASPGYADVTPRMKICTDPADSPYMLLTKEQYAEAVDVLRRMREWDHLPTTADGPYWLREIDKVLTKIAPPHPDLRAG